MTETAKTVRKISIRKKAEAFDRMTDFITALAEFAPDETTRTIASRLRDRDWLGLETTAPKEGE